MKTTRPDDLGFASHQFNEINQFTDTYINKGELAGTLTLVARQGKIAHLECRGKMSLETNQAMRTDAIFRIYSMTKPVTSIAAMMLYERGAFAMDTPISTFIPEFKDVEVYVGGPADNYQTVKPEREINMRDLLTHTAGMTYDFNTFNAVDEVYRQRGIKSFNNSMTLAEFATQVAKAPLLFSPGTYFNYSVATDVLGRIIEVISGMPLDTFFKNEILLPLGMHDTDFYVPKEKQHRFTTNYLHHTAMPIEAKQQAPDQKLFMFDHPESGTFSQPPAMLSGGGGLTSTAHDYLQFATMLMNKGRFGENQRLISAETFALMTANQLPTELAEYSFVKDGGANMPGYGFGYGFGINLARGEFGWSGAANTYFIVDPNAEMVAMFLTQLFPFDLSQEMFQGFKNHVYKAIV
jgi:CubicO group peptidase (beta-lactamase class C family)